MFIKKGDSFLIALIFFLLGIIVCYIACQYEVLNINTEINVLETLFALGTFGIGVYIAIIIQRRRNKSQNFYVYVEGKYDVLWEDFIRFSEVLEFSVNIELKEVSKSKKSIDMKIAPLIKIFKSFEYDTECLTNIETKIDELEVLLTNSKHIQDQIIDLSPDKEQISAKLNAINEDFALTFKTLNNLS